MLFDLRNPARKRTVQAIYLVLAVLMGGGLVFFGIGGDVSGGLVDAFRSDSGGQTDGRFEKIVKQAERATVARPRDPEAWSQLARVRYQQSTQGENYDQASGSFTEKGRTALARVEQAWDRYVALEPDKIDANLAPLMLQAFGPAALNKPEKAVVAAEAVAEARPSANTYAQLAQFAYAAGQIRKGDLAADKAIELSPKDERESVRGELDQLRPAGAPKRR